MSHRRRCRLALQQALGSIARSKPEAATRRAAHQFQRQAVEIRVGSNRGANIVEPIIVVTKLEETDAELEVRLRISAIAGE